MTGGDVEKVITDNFVDFSCYLSWNNIYSGQAIQLLHKKRAGQLPGSTHITLNNIIMRGRPRHHDTGYNPSWCWYSQERPLSHDRNGIPERPPELRIGA